MAYEHASPICGSLGPNVITLCRPEPPIWIASIAAIANSAFAIHRTLGLAGVSKRPRTRHPL